MTDEFVTVLIHYLAMPDQLEAATSALTNLIGVVVIEEHDCLGITMHQELGRPEHIVLVEEWTSREAFAGAHMETPYLKQFMARAADWFAGPPAITFWLRTAEESPA